MTMKSPVQPPVQRLSYDRARLAQAIRAGHEATRQAIQEAELGESLVRAAAADLHKTQRRKWAWLYTLIILAFAFYLTFFVIDRPPGF
jgi:hypothetical protein